MATVIGLTGGIASGKTMVSRYLEEKGHPVLDTDLIARQVVEPGSPGLQAVVAAFGEGILQPDGHLNRATLGEIVFSDDQARQTLNALLHPLIRREVQMYLATTQEELVFLVVPLLYESGYEAFCDDVWLVTAPEDIRRARLMTRDGLSEEAAEGRLRAQMSEEEKKGHGPKLIENKSTPEDLLRQVDALIKERSTQ